MEPFILRWRGLSFAVLAENDRAPENDLEGDPLGTTLLETRRTVLQVYPAAPKRQRPSRTSHDDDGGLSKRKWGNVGKREIRLLLCLCRKK
ncbi:endogenous retrovirus group K member 10 Np9 protein-like isoform X2 [Pan paniscus]|uniref:endogenous retrovirus group K member 10 Np9 protein-like isoform X2 n=1 Tax=Pan paniscus TaxID=9597 RepID=UPI0006C992D7|nr:endogenous retrovirus group K member 10 Np9 protein-like isoform X2 [Pan paniscus]